MSFPYMRQHSRLWPYCQQLAWLRIPLALDWMLYVQVYYARLSLWNIWGYFAIPEGMIDQCREPMHPQHHCHGMNHEIWLSWLTGHTDAQRSSNYKICKSSRNSVSAPAEMNKCDVHYKKIRRKRIFRKPLGLLNNHAICFPGKIGFLNNPRD